MKQFKNSLASVVMWFAENPQRVRLIVAVISTAATVAMLIAGLTSGGLLVAGPASGGGGGPEAFSIGIGG